MQIIKNDLHFYLTTMSIQFRQSLFALLALASLPHA